MKRESRRRPRWLLPAAALATVFGVADWGDDAFKAYGATSTDGELQVAVIDSDGRIASFFAATPTAAELDAAIVRASGSSP